jgi:hypothetical protein
VGQLQRRTGFEDVMLQSLRDVIFRAGLADPAMTRRLFKTLEV